MLANRSAALCPADQQGHQRPKFLLSVCFSPSVSATPFKVLLQQFPFSPGRSLSGRKEVSAEQPFSSWRKSFPGIHESHGLELDRVAHPWANQRQVRHHIWTQADHDFSSLSGPWQPKHRRDSTQKDGGRAVEGETAPRSLFPALTVLSSDCTFPTVWTTYLNVLLPQTQSVRGKFLFPSNRWLLFLHFSTFPVVVSSIHPPWRLQP